MTAAVIVTLVVIAALALVVAALVSSRDDPAFGPTVFLDPDGIWRCRDHPDFGASARIDPRAALNALTAHLRTHPVVAPPGYQAVIMDGSPPMLIIDPDLPPEPQ